MSQLSLNNLYLPLSRDLNYQRHLVINGDVLETQSGGIIPIAQTDMRFAQKFIVNNALVTQEELSALQDFYQKYFYQRFRFMDTQNSQKTCGVVEVPNGIRTLFNVVNDAPDILYLVQSAKIYMNNQIISNATLNQNLQITFAMPPAINTVIKAIIDYDYAVMFDYDFGLQSIFDPPTQSFKISFQLCVQD